MEMKSTWTGGDGCNNYALAGLCCIIGAIDSDIYILSPGCFFCNMC